MDIHTIMKIHSSSIFLRNTVCNLTYLFESQKYSFHIQMGTLKYYFNNYVLNFYTVKFYENIIIYIQTFNKHYFSTRSMSFHNIYHCIHNYMKDFLKKKNTPYSFLVLLNIKHICYDILRKIKLFI